MADIKKTERILNLVSFLFKVRGRRLVTWREVRETVAGYDDGGSAGTLRRRFERDKRFLETLGIELEYVQDASGEGGYRVRRDATLMPPISIGPGEEALLSALAASVPPRDTPFARHLQSALLKLRFDSPASPDVAEGLAGRILPAAACTEVGDAARLARLGTFGEAVALCRTVTFDYGGLENGPLRSARRTLDPYGLFARGSTWYAVGRCHSRDAIRTFKVDRIRGAIDWTSPGEGPDFAVPEEFSLEDHSNPDAWRRGEEAFEARVWFDPACFFRVARRPDARAGAPAPDGSGEATFGVSNADAFVRWLLSFGRHARVLSPPDLARRLAERVRATLAGYEP
ncbi:MAG: WYL domain-containing protein [Planctomycetes bacterium]|nr:WYL domain-containing protein [Planctomycetota bacterium]